MQPFRWLVQAAVFGRLCAWEQGCGALSRGRDRAAARHVARCGTRRLTPARRRRRPPVRQRLWLQEELSDPM